MNKINIIYTNGKKEVISEKNGIYPSLKIDTNVFLIKFINRMDNKYDVTKIRVIPMLKVKEIRLRGLIC